MATTVAIVAAVATVASAAYGVYSNIQASDAAQAAARAQRAQQDENRALLRTQAAQQEADRREELNRIIGAQQALRGARGLDIAGVGGQVMAETAAARAERDVANIQMGQMAQDRRLQLAGDAAQFQADASSAGYTARAVEGGVGVLRGAGNLYGYMTKA
jgi:hypothetical protein